MIVLRVWYPLQTLKRCLYVLKHLKESSKATGQSEAVFASPDLILILKQWWGNGWEMHAFSFCATAVFLIKASNVSYNCKIIFFGRCSLLFMLKWPQSCIFFPVFILRWSVSLLPVTLSKLRDSSENGLGIIFITTFSLIYASARHKLSTSTPSRCFPLWMLLEGAPV